MLCGGVFDYRYRTSEERWAFIARQLCCILDAPTGQPYYVLHELLADKNYHILTTYSRMSEMRRKYANPCSD
ncbi:hypothetical protein D7V86_12710 [bacterium D16-51]|nr:hypothetical protein D7V96_14495 [bacterium D16-59]RKI59540.1 hypothetical protein D7V86_12710 [bacterium D16-51]